MHIRPLKKQKPETMKKKYAKEQLQEVITRVNNIMNNDKVVCFRKPIAIRLTKKQQTMLGKDWNYT